MNRRQVLVGGGVMLLLPSAARSQDAWYALKGDDGQPVANMRIPVEIAVEADNLTGATRIGADAPDATLVEFFDYNCPYCRVAARDLDEMVKADTDLALVVIHNPVLSGSSQDAARVQLAVLRAHGPNAAYDLHKGLYQRKGRIDAPRALDVAKAMGLDTTALAAEAESRAVRDMLDRHMRLASSLGFVATPSFLVAGAGISGYPGPKATAEIVNAVKSCGGVTC